MLLTRDESRGLRSNTLRRPVLSTIAGLVLLAAATSAKADSPSLDFDSTPVTDAVAQIDNTFNAHITVKPGVNVDQTVTFGVSDINQPGARLEAINDLANALGASYSKSFVISKSIDDVGTAQPAVDAVGAPIVFPNGQASAEDAIRAVAGVDDASVQFYSPIHGTVTFTSSQLTADQAAREIAQQTHTVWKAYYAITPRQEQSTSGAYGEKIIGYTASGSPITELPVDTFRPADKPEPPSTTTAEADKPKDTKADTNTAQAEQSANTPYNYGYGYPYGYPSYYGGYPAYYPGYGDSSLVIGSNGAMTPYGSGYNPYGGYGYGAPYGGYGFGTVGNGVYVPYGGGYYGGGATIIGGNSIFSTGIY